MSTNDAATRKSSLLALFCKGSWGDFRVVVDCSRELRRDAGE